MPRDFEMCEKNKRERKTVVPPKKHRNKEKTNERGQKHTGTRARQIKAILQPFTRYFLFNFADNGQNDRHRLLIVEPFVSFGHKKHLLCPTPMI